MMLSSVLRSTASAENDALLPHQYDIHTAHCVPRFVHPVGRAGTLHSQTIYQLASDSSLDPCLPRV